MQRLSSRSGGRAELPGECIGLLLAADLERWKDANSSLTRPSSLAREAVY